MFRNFHCRVLRDISCDLFRTFFIDKASKTTHIDVLSICHGILHDCKEGFYRYLDIRFIDSSLLRYFRYYVRFRHLEYVLKDLAIFGDAKIKFEARK